MSEDGAVPVGLLREFAVWCKRIRPHQHFHDFIPAEVWHGISPYGYPRQHPFTILQLGMSYWEEVICGQLHRLKAKKTFIRVTKLFGKILAIRHRSSVSRPMPVHQSALQIIIVKNYAKYFFSPLTVFFKAAASIKMRAIHH
ncbi:hypothetical protein [Undibacterium sp. TJN19]|uniref:hypothetical protein n=1 Tax=Undibacterium sp. TJN19 TaxID=3413055 RepID=UPI003BF0BDE5